ncbi:HXXEE domain-containing protein [Ligilactobacillus sp. LYQ135]|nr:HXXEE domain-containing protein [uncultured Ligilactobacillus sp.]
MLQTVFVISIFPSIFMLHEMEEIIYFKKFGKFSHHYNLPKSIIKVNRKITSLSTAKFASVVFEEFILLLLISFLCLYKKNETTSLIYAGFMSAYNIHIIFHIVQSIYLKKYVPGLVGGITSFFITCILINLIWNFSIIHFILITIFCLIFIIINLWVCYYLLLRKAS